MEGGGAKIKKSHREWRQARQRRERDLEQFVPAGQMRSENRRLSSESVFEEREVREGASVLSGRESASGNEEKCEGMSYQVPTTCFKD